MEHQPDLFDAGLGEQLKDEGMAAAADNKRSLLRHARKLAVSIALARASREVTADDVQAALAAEGISVRALGNAAGSLFHGPLWTFTGKFVKSERAHAHRNLLRVWKYLGN